MLNALFGYAVACGFASSNPVATTQSVEVRSTGDIAIYTPAEFRRLLGESQCLAPQLRELPSFNRRRRWAGFWRVGQFTERSA